MGSGLTLGAAAACGPMARGGVWAACDGGRSGAPPLFRRQRSPCPDRRQPRSPLPFFVALPLPLPGSPLSLPFELGASMGRRDVTVVSPTWGAPIALLELTRSPHSHLLAFNHISRLRFTGPRTLTTAAASPGLPVGALPPLMSTPGPASPTTASSARPQVRHP